MRIYTSLRPKAAASRCLRPAPAAKLKLYTLNLTTKPRRSRRNTKKCESIVTQWQRVTCIDVTTMRNGTLQILQSHSIRSLFFFAFLRDLRASREHLCRLRRVVRFRVLVSKYKIGESP